jgi:hypothetical protein
MGFLIIHCLTAELKQCIIHIHTYISTIMDLYVNPVAGLCNRLRVICSYYAEAKKRGCKLYIKWNPCPACPAQFNDLFVIPPMNDIFINPNIVFPANTIETFSACILDTSEWILYFDNLFVPREHINNKINDIINLMGNNFNALHIRHTDHNNKYEKDPEYLQYIESDEPMNIYVASDNQQSLNTIKNIKGNFVFTSSRFNYHGFRHTSIEDAVVDLWVCRSSYKFCGTYWSSFTDMIVLNRKYKNKDSINHEMVLK